MINIAVLGTNFGMNHIEIYQKIENLTIKYVFGRNQDTLSKIHRENGIPVTDRFEDILEDGSIDLVDICLPTELHHEYAIRALEKSKHVFCETPISFSLREAEEIARVADRQKKQVFVDMFTKYSAPHQIGINYAKRHKLGKIHFIEAYNKTPSIWGDLSIERSVFTFFIHNLDFLLEILGSPKSVASYGIDMKGRSVIQANYGYEGAMATLISDSSLPENAPFLIGYDIVGEKGSVRFRGSFGEEAEQSVHINLDGEERKVEVPDTDDYEQVIHHVLECIKRDEKSPNLDIVHALASLETAIKTREKIVVFS